MTITADTLHDTLVETFTEGQITVPNAASIMGNLVRLRLVKPIPAEHFTGDFDATYEDPDVLDRRNGRTL